MYQDMNGNMEQPRHAGCLMFQRKFLPEMYAEMRRQSLNYSDAKVPDTEINLECDEVIEDWDDIDEFNAYPAQSPETKASHDGYTIESESIDADYDYPPPNSPADGADVDRSTWPEFQSRYVNSLLQIWRDGAAQPNDDPVSAVLASIDNDNTGGDDDDDDDKLVDDSGHEHMSLPSDDSASDSCSQESELLEAFNTGSTSLPNVSSHPHFDTTQPHDFGSARGSGASPEFESPPSPLSPSSSRASSPEIFQALSPSVLRMTFDNLRSISPRIERSPSPLDSRPSSPWFQRSPSPLDHLSELSDSLVFYDERYIVRSVSPQQRISDHQVPDVDSDFYQLVATSSEFPSPRSHQRQRWLNSCADQVVPEWIEE